MTEATQRSFLVSSVHSTLDDCALCREVQTLARAGYSVTLIAQHTSGELVNRVRIIALPRPRSRLTRIPFVSFKALRAALHERACIYHLHDPELLPWGWILQKVTGKPVVYDVHEYYAEGMLAKAWIPRILRPLAARLVGMLERFFAKRVAAVITVNVDMEQQFRRVNRRSISVYNCPDLTLTEGVPRGRRSDPYRIVYIGGVSKFRGYATLIRALDVAAPAEPRVTCIVIRTADRSGVSASTLGLERSLIERGTLSLRGAVPHEDIPLYLVEGSAGWTPWQSTLNNGRATPVKLREYMAAGLTVVASSLRFINEAIKTGGRRLLVKSGDAAQPAGASVKLLLEPALSSGLREAARKAVLERYNRQNEGEELVSLYRELVSEAA